MAHENVKTKNKIHQDLQAENSLLDPRIQFGLVPVVDSGWTAAICSHPYCLPVRMVLPFSASFWLWWGPLNVQMDSSLNLCSLHSLHWPHRSLSLGSQLFFPGFSDHWLQWWISIQLHIWLLFYHSKLSDWQCAEGNGSVFASCSQDTKLCWLSSFSSRRGSTPARRHNKYFIRIEAQTSQSHWAFGTLEPMSKKWKAVLELVIDPDYLGLFLHNGGKEGFSSLLLCPVIAGNKKLHETPILQEKYRQLRKAESRKNTLSQGKEQLVILYQMALKAHLPITSYRLRLHICLKQLLKMRVWIWKRTRLNRNVLREEMEEDNVITNICILYYKICNHKNMWNYIIISKI